MNHVNNDDDETPAQTARRRYHGSILGVLFHGHDVFSSSSVADGAEERILHDDDLAELLFDCWLLRQPVHPHHQ
jgi:hypothetical protein